VPAAAAGFLAALFGMIAGSLAAVIRHQLTAHAAAHPRHPASRLPAQRAYCEYAARRFSIAGMRHAHRSLALLRAIPYYLYAGTLAKGVDAAAWLVLLAPSRQNRIRRRRPLAPHRFSLARRQD
jgi:hypothetical protein